MPDRPAHFILIAAGTKGDMHPFISLAQALQRRGREVTFIGPAFHAEVLQQAGLPFVSIGSKKNYWDAVNNPDIWHHRKGFAILLKNYRSRLEEIGRAIGAIAAQGPCVAIAHPLALPAAALARETGAPLQIVGAYLAPSNLRSCHDPLLIGPLKIPRWVPMRWRAWLWRLIDKRVVDPVAVVEVDAARSSFGLPPIASFNEHMSAVPDLSVTLFPDWFASVRPDWPRPLHSGNFQLFDPNGGQPLTAELERFLRAGDCPIVFTPGTGHVHAQAYFAAVVRAVQRLGRRAVLLTPQHAQVPADLPASVLWLPYVPLRDLLPHVAALVHHGGIGTTAEALHAGVAQLVVPFAWDQFDNAARVAALGVGEVLPASRLSVRRLERKLRAVLASADVRASCIAVAERFKGGSDADALCAEIETALDRAVTVPQ